MKGNNDETMVTPEMQVHPRGQAPDGMFMSEHISSQEEQVMIKQMEQYRAGIAEERESNGHSPNNTNSMMGMPSQRNPLDASALQEFQRNAEIRGQINVPRREQPEMRTGTLKKPGKTQRIPMPMSRTLISDIIYPVQTKKGLKYGKQRQG